jgi:hypothetical protein
MEEEVAARPIVEARARKTAAEQRARADRETDRAAFRARQTQQTEPA